MIPPNIKARLEEILRQHKCSSKWNYITSAEDGLYYQGITDLWQILTEGAGEFDEKEAYNAITVLLNPYTKFDEDWSNDYRRGFVKGARWQFNQLKPKMMAMDAEIQRLRTVMKDTASAPPKYPESDQPVQESASQVQSTS